MKSRTVPYGDSNRPTEKQFMKRQALSVPCFSTSPQSHGPFWKHAPSYCNLKIRDTQRNSQIKKSHLKNKNKCKHFFTLEIQAMRSGNTYTGLWEQRVHDVVKNEKVFFFPYLKKKTPKQLLPHIHCSTEHAHSISLMNYFYTKIRQKLVSTFPCSIR